MRTGPVISPSTAHEPVGLSDFTTTRRTLFITSIAMLIGVAGSFAAKGLLELIALFTNLFFFQRASFEAALPAEHRLGPVVVLVPVAGALVIGLLARFGSERIRGHGIPEAIESILLHGSRVPAKLALLKPLSAAVSIGSGGPFGAEGPIVMTGGALGSLVAQSLHLTSAERKTLLVAGAASGMSATFGAPLAAVLLAVELLLFELKPRSLVPVAAASATAAALRFYLLGPTPLFPTPAHPTFVGISGLAACVACGLLAGALSFVLTRSVYAAEDAFQKLPFHWMWWPAIGGLVVGLGGLVFPRALGVGYDVLGDLVAGRASDTTLVLVLVVKGVIWCVALGSGTSGGVLAPLLILGGALGGLEARVFPDFGAGFWPLVGMAAMLGGTMRSPLTGALFMIEVTQDFNVALPLLTATVVAHAFTVLLLPRSILTEKIARRGFHVTREYSIDPLEVLFVREIMLADVMTIPADTPVSLAAHALHSAGNRQRLYPVVDDDGRLAGAITRREIETYRFQHRTHSMRSDMRTTVVAIHVGDTLKTAVHRMADSNRTTLPVLDRSARVVGLLAFSDVLRARARHLEEERRRERWITPPLPSLLLRAFGLRGGDRRAGVRGEVS